MKQRKEREALDNPFKEFDDRIQKILSGEDVEEEKKKQQLDKDNQKKELEVDPTALRFFKLPPDTLPIDLEEALALFKSTIIKLRLVEEKDKDGNIIPGKYADFGFVHFRDEKSAKYCYDQ